MKKLFLFMTLTALTISLNSCSSSDSGGSSIGGTITLKINGTSKTFNTVVVNQEVFEAGTPDEYTDLTITGAIGTSTTEIITIELQKESLGANAIYNFTYTNGATSYYWNFIGGSNGSVLSTNVTTNNTGKKLVGNFSGSIYDFGIESVTIADGTFNIQY